MDVRNIDSYNKSYLEGLERSSQFSYSSQYFWWKKYSVLEKSLLKIISENYSNAVKIRIIDIGCQIGHDIFKLSSALKNYNIEWTGIDVNPDFLKICNFRKSVHCNHRYFFLAASIENLVFKNGGFDIIISSEVFEHIKNTNAAASSLKNVLKTDSFLIISTPNVTNYCFAAGKFISKNIIKKIYSDFSEETKKEFEYKKKIQVKNEEDHINLKTMDAWKTIFEKSGFKILSCKRGSMFYGSKYIDKRPFLFIIITFCDIIFDFIPCFKKWSYNFFLIMKN
ncbi:MAG TPA: class I SAM-dependent methyltransferase [bacterium]|nr:class I SAM-dependent methyltransferase [bacterium]HPN29878.1 class I SAM-dependent methyltransferase [bacterium]